MDETIVCLVLKKPTSGSSPVKWSRELCGRHSSLKKDGLQMNGAPWRA